MQPTRSTDSNAFSTAETILCTSLILSVITELVIGILYYKTTIWGTNAALSCSLGVGVGITLYSSLAFFHYAHKKSHIEPIDDLFEDQPVSKCICPIFDKKHLFIAALLACVAITNGVFGFTQMIWKPARMFFTEPSFALGAAGGLGGSFLLHASYSSLN